MLSAPTLQSSATTKSSFPIYLLRDLREIPVRNDGLVQLNRVRVDLLLITENFALLGCRMRGPGEGCAGIREEPEVEEVAVVEVLLWLVVNWLRLAVNWLRLAVNWLRSIESLSNLDLLELFNADWRVWGVKRKL